MAHEIRLIQLHFSYNDFSLSILGWRGVVYVCYRPRSEFSFKELQVLEDCIKENRGTNHWATRVFSQQRGRGENYSPEIQRLIEQPRLVYDTIKFTPHMKSYLINEAIEM